MQAQFKVQVAFVAIALPVLRDLSTSLCKFLFLVFWSRKKNEDRLLGATTPWMEEVERLRTTKWI